VHGVPRSRPSAQGISDAQHPAVEHMDVVRVELPSLSVHDQVALDNAMLL
jgi:hypothetical protein